MTESVQLAVRPKRYIYKASAATEFWTRLYDTYQCSATVPLNDPRDVEMAQDGTLKANGYRFAHLALRQICQAGATGLWNFISDVGGMVRRDGSRDCAQSTSLAISAFNAVVKLRFRAKDGLRGKQLVQNNLDKLIDGIVGRSYRFLAHHQLFDSVQDLLTGGEHAARFYEGLLLGRRIGMTFLFDDMTIAVGTHVLRGGYYFTNSEAGECGVHAAFVLQLEGTPYRCMAKPLRVAHAGKDFNSKLQQLLGDVLLKSGDFDNLHEVMAALNQPLELLTGNQLDLNRKKVLHRMLIRAKLSGQIVNGILHDAIYRGAEGEQTPPTIDASEMRSRTMFDIFVATMRKATRLDLTRREKLERTAFNILSGKLGIR